MDKLDFIKLDLIRIRKRLNERRYDGGPGSGNWGHAGRKGEVGGSAEGTGGSGNRYKDANGNYTSYAKMKHSMAKSHQTNTEELKSCPVGTKLITKDGKFTKLNDTKWTNDSTGEVIGSYTLNHSSAWGTNVKIAIPKEGVDVGAYMKKHGAESASEKKSKGGTSKSKSSSKSKESGGFSSNYSAERISKAKKLTDIEADDKYREETGEIWNKCSDSEKHSLFEYTSGSSFVNEPLRHIQYAGYKSYSSVKAIHDITKAIDSTKGLTEDTTLHRGVGKGGLSQVLGISKEQLINLMSDPSQLVGMEGKDDAFMSTGISEGKILDDKPIIMEIFAPKGTKGLYCEPFSDYGEGDKLGWDGESGQSEFGPEQEYLLQRGTSIKITAAEKKGTKVYLKCVVTGQDYSDNPEEKFAKYAKNY
jgi:hypothetical protein